MFLFGLQGVTCAFPTYDCFNNYVKFFYMYVYVWCYNVPSPCGKEPRPTPELLSLDVLDILCFFSVCVREGDGRLGTRPIFTSKN